MGWTTRTTALVCALLGLASPALAVAPPLGVQGRLQSAAGLPVPDGNYDLAVRFFPGAAGGSSLFEVKQGAVAVQSGLFDLGVTPGAALFAGQPEVWLELQVGVDPALSRTRLGAVPYALHASLADALACTGCVAAEQVAFNYAGSNQKGGPATSAADLLCTGCVGVAEMKFDADVDLAGHAITAKEFIGSGAKLTGLPAAPQGDCTPGQVVTGIGADGKLKCAAGNTYSGNDFALAGQACAAGLMVVGIDALGKPVCGAAAQSGQACQAGQVVTGFDAGGKAICAPGGTLTGVTGSAPIVSSGGATPNLNLAQATGTANGFLASADWTAFSSKVASVAASVDGGLAAGGTATAPTLGLITTCASGQILKWNGSAWACAADTNSGGTVSGVTGSAPIVSSGGATPNLTMAQANASASGFLASADWTAFSSKVASVAASAGGGLVAGGTATAPTLGLITSCSSGQVLKWNGSAWACATEGGALPADGLAAVSNGLLTNQFTASIASTTTPVTIKDYFPPGQTDSIVVPDLGIAQKLTVSVDISNSDISGLTVYLYDPTNMDPLVPGYVLYDKSASGTKLATSYPDLALPKSGNLTAWVGKNPKGTWKLKVVDGVFKDGGTDGAVNSWKITVQTLSAKKVAATGDLAVNGVLTGGGGMLNVAGGLLVAGQPVARVWSATSDALADGASLELPTGTTDPLLGATGWVAYNGGWQATSSAGEFTSVCSSCGDGSDGDLVVLGNTTITLANSNYNFQNFVVRPGAVLKFSAKTPVSISVLQSALISGKVDLSGSGGGCGSKVGVGTAGGGDGGLGGSNNGGDGSGPGAGGGGPYNGSAYYTGGGGGGGHVTPGADGQGGQNNTPGGKGGAAYGDAALSGGLEPGSGGGGGALMQQYYNPSQGGNAGGGGGGAIQISAGRIVVSSAGAISADGGAGTYGCENSWSKGSGAGSGGTIWVRSSSVEVNGSLSVKSGAVATNWQGGVFGAAGSAGRIRIDGSLAGSWSGAYYSGPTTGLSPALINRFPITQPTAGTVRLTNNSGATQKVRLVVMR